MMVTWWTGSAPGVERMTTAWPASWNAVRRFSLSLITLLFFLGPAMTLVMASSRSSIWISEPLRLAVSSAASFIMFSMSAGVKPGVRLARTFRSTSLPSGLFLECTRNTASLPLMSGVPIVTSRSKRPGLKMAGSRTSGRLVAASTMMPSLTPKPSISTSSWLRVCSRSSLPPPMPAPLLRPTASISSMKTMHGEFFFASSNRSRTRLAPTPTNISTKSEPEMLKNGTPASPATALEM